MASTESESSTYGTLSSKGFAKLLQGAKHFGLLENRPGQQPLPASKLQAAGVNSAPSVTPIVPASSTDTPDESVQIKELLIEIITSGLTSVLGPNRKRSKIIVVGAGAAGLASAYELKRAGMEVVLLEASHRIGGRVKTFRDPAFAPGLHAEGGAMRLPEDHFAVHEYLKRFKKQDQLEPFEQKNKVIYLSGLGKTLLYDDFNKMLKERNKNLLKLFPNLKEKEKGKTVDMLWDEAIKPVQELFNSVYKPEKPKTLRDAYAKVFKMYDKYSLDSYFREVAGWSDDCVRLYDLGSAHVVLDNGFVESWKDSFLSSNDQGQEAGMKQMKEGMESILKPFLTGVDGMEGADGLINDIIFGAEVRGAKLLESGKVKVEYATTNGDAMSVEGDFVIFTVPLPVMRCMRFDPPFSTEKNTAIRTVRYVEVTKILLQFRTRWWEKWFTDNAKTTPGGLVTDLPIRYLAFPTAESAQITKPHQKRGAIMASYVFQQDATLLAALPLESQIRTAVDDIATIFGEHIKAELEVGVVQKWPSDTLSGGSAFAYFGPGERTRLFEPMLKGEWKNKFGQEVAQFAGEHASFTHGWIQGAFESALIAAYQVYRQIPSA